MGVAMSIKEAIGGGVIALSGISFAILGLVIHVWTTVIAFIVSGLFAAVLTLVFPVLSQIYWFFKVGSNIGYDTLYCVSIMAYVALIVIVFIFSAIFSK
jgi:hypothetical protein